jgi:hypothetical protein
MTDAEINAAKLTNGNDPAWPVEYENGMAEIKTLGLSKREWFAGLAMQGILAGLISHRPLNDNDALALAAGARLVGGMAVQQADALMVELNK